MFKNIFTNNTCKIPHVTIFLKKLLKLILGSIIHHTVHCLIIAYHTNRSMILNSENLSYNDDDFIQPFSKTCRNISSDAGKKHWKGKIQNFWEHSYKSYLAISNNNCVTPTPPPNFYI